MCQCVLEHWRDGECVSKYVFSVDDVERDGDMVRFTFPIGYKVLASYDELRFSISDMLDVMSEVQRPWRK